MIDSEILNDSWLHGKYNIAGLSCEINTMYSYIAVGDDWFFQGQDASEFISEIHQIWIHGNCTTEEAFINWINMYLY